MLPLAWPGDALWSGPRPWVNVSHAAGIGRAAGHDARRKSCPPASAASVAGSRTPFEEDRYRVPVTPGSKLRFEVFAERCGSPVDAAILIRNEEGDLLARGEDGTDTLDPALDYAVPANVTAILACVVDAQGRGDANGTYRLAIELPRCTAP